MPRSVTKMRRPSFHDLTAAQQAQFGNGLGPFWFPRWLRNLITGAGSWFFDDACWRHHDFGYEVGGDRFDRARCDWKFFWAMLKDAISQPGLFWVLKFHLAILISIAFYLAVRLVGARSFQYRDRYLSTAEVLGTYR